MVSLVTLYQKGSGQREDYVDPIKLLWDFKVFKFHSVKES